MPEYRRARWAPTFDGPTKVARVGGWYEAFVPDPVASLDVALGSSLAQELVEAEKAVQALQDRAAAITGLEALAPLLLRAESNASSRIEGLRVGPRRLARAAFDPEMRDRTAREVVGNIRAMEAAVAVARRPERLAASNLLAMHRILLQGAWEERIAGVLRTTQNWIGGNDWNPVGAAYVPPPPEEVPALLDDLAVFANRGDIPAILQAAVAHAQFELIHPFGDGNGRVGRCLIHAVLVRRGLAERFVPPVSLVLAANARSYIAGLTHYREGDTAAWVSLFATAMRTAAEQALRLADDIASQQRRWLELAGHPRRDSTAAHLIERLAGSPIVDTASVQRMVEVSHEAARTALLQLEDAGVLRPLSTSRYRRAWAATEVFTLMEAVERRLASPIAVATPEPPKRPRRRSPSRAGTHR
jgi:Fic family protein